MFSVDYPFEDTRTATDWLARAALTDGERNAVAWENAARLMKLPL